MNDYFENEGENTYRPTENSEPVNPEAPQEEAAALRNEMHEAAAPRNEAPQDSTGYTPPQVPPAYRSEPVSNGYVPPVYQNNPYTPPVYQSQPQGYTPPYHTQSAAPKKPRRKGMTAGRVVALGLCCAIVGGTMGLTGAYFGGMLTRETNGSGSSSTVLEGKREGTVLDVNYIDTSKEMTAAEVYAANVGSTVGITTSITTNYWGYQTTSAASGSGFILTADGYILTNYHVVEGASSISVSLHDGTSYDAVLIGYDESNDIAVLKVEAEGLTPVVLGSSEKLNVGDTVIAIGNPLGELTFSLTQGVVSALDREVTISGGATMDLIQTDCAINSGNSGGALFNLYGEVIGITNAKYSSNGTSSSASIDNIGFAIPIDNVRSIVESIIEKGYVSKPYIGVTVSNVGSQAQSYGIPAGAAIQSIAASSPAEQAGLRINDVITAVNGTTITDTSALIDLVGAAEIGDTLTLTVYRDGETITLTLTVGEQIQSAAPSEDDMTDDSQDSQGVNPWDFGFGG